MSSTTASEKKLRAENAELRARLEETQETLRAIRAGEVDGLVVEGDAGPQLFVLQSADAEASRFRSDILAKVDEAIVALDEERKVVFLNAAAERQYEVAGSEVLGRPLSALYENRWFVPEDEAHALAALRATGHWRGKSIHVKRRGEIIHVETSVSRMLAADGTPSGLLAVIRDITEQKRAEDAVRARTEENAALLDALPAFVWICLDGECRVITGNRAANELLGIAAGTNVSQSSVPTGEAVPLRQLKEDGTEYRTEELPMQRAVATGQPVRGALLDFRFPDGRSVQALGNTMPLLDEHGQPRGAVAAFVDVTARKRAEEALRLSEGHFRAMADAMAQLAWIARADGYLYWYNQRWYEYTGTTPQEMEGWGWQSVHDPEVLPKVMEFWKASIATGEPFDMIFPLRGADGKFRRFLTRGQPLKDARGRVIQWFGTNTDVEELQRVELALKEAKEAAELASQSKDRFLAVLSHELRTPLTPVLMAVGALEHDPDLRPEVREDLTMIKRNVELETKLIDDLLDLNRITSGKLPLAIEPVDLNEAVRQVCATCLPPLRERAIRLETTLDEAAGMVAADAARLQQVLWNVLKNAIKFTPEEGAIRVSTRRLEGARCEVRVEDSGVGIPPEVLPRIFDAFEQGDASVTRQFGGLGLGLAICKALVDLHHGAIRAESAGPGQGSTFIVELPTVAPLAGGKPDDTAPADQLPHSQLRLLVVEDHADTARTLSRLLRRAGYAVLTAVDVASAMALAAREPFDLLISDLGLPDGSGFDIMRAVRAQCRVPGIAMSGYGMDEDVRRSREAGFTEHLVKPVNLPQLLAAIRRVTDNRG